MKEIGLYLHFPFCRHKCFYCDFPSYAGMEDLMAPYLNALKMEIGSWADRLSEYKVKTIFLGGGTPTLFAGKDIADIINTCFQRLRVKEDAEITIESNPGTLDKGKLFTLRAAGINRLSMGLQAWQEEHLRKLGRIHGQKEWIDNVNWARMAGFDNLNVDIMFGLPGQTLAEWEETLSAACDQGVEHVSAYSLKIEEDTRFDRWLAEGSIVLPQEDEEREMYHQAIDFLENNGIMQYEISNFARKGRMCEHNLVYWRNEAYLGCGSGAHSFLEGERFANTPSVKDYINSINSCTSPVSFREKTDLKEERFETIMLGLRLSAGIDKKRYRERFGTDIMDDFGPAVRSMKRQGLLEANDQSVYLTARGMDLQNTVLMEFMS